MVARVRCISGVHGKLEERYRVVLLVTGDSGQFHNWEVLIC